KSDVHDKKNEMNYKSFKEMLKKVFFSLFVAAAISCGAGPRIDISAENPQLLKPDAAQGIIVKDLVSLFETVHYKKVPFNYSLSSVIYDEYLKSLDPGKNYFLKSDITEFEKYRENVLEDLKEGDLSVMFHMFNVYQQRYLERLRYAASQVKSDFDFSTDETYTYNREKEDWFASNEEAEQVWKKRVKYDMLTLKMSRTGAEKEDQA